MKEIREKNIWFLTDYYPTSDDEPLFPYLLKSCNNFRGHNFFFSYYDNFMENDNKSVNDNELLRFINENNICIVGLYEPFSYIDWTEVFHLYPNLKIIVIDSSIDYRHFEDVNVFGFIDMIDSYWEDNLVSTITRAKNLLKVEIENSLKIVEEDRFLFFIEISSVFKNSFKIYLQYFETFVKLTKGIVLTLTIKDEVRGIILKFSNLDNYVNNISDWLDEYVSFLFFNDKNINVLFNIPVSKSYKSLVINDLLNQINSLKTNLKQVKALNEELKNDKELLKEIIVKIKSNSPRISNNEIGKLEDKFIKNDLTFVIKKLLLLTKNKNPAIYSELLLHFSNLNSLEDNGRKGLISFETETLQKNKLKNALLKLIRKLEVEFSSL